MGLQRVLFPEKLGVRFTCFVSRMGGQAPPNVHGW